MGMNQQEIKNLIGQKDEIVIFEVGCADGLDTKKFLNTFESNLKIYTFDPEPINVEYMTTLGSKDAWGNNNDILVTDERHRFYPYAVSGENGKTTFHRSRNDCAEGRTVGRYSGSICKPVTMINSPKYGRRWPGCLFDEEVEVETKRLDTFCEENNISHIDFLWMDTQGAERDVISGIGSMLENIDYIYTEYYDEEMYENCAGLEEIKNLLPGFQVVSDWRYNDADGGDVLFRRIK
jgi:FkbM family methyltransferase